MVTSLQREEDYHQLRLFPESIRSTHSLPSGLQIQIVGPFNRLIKERRKKRDSPIAEEEEGGKEAHEELYSSELIEQGPVSTRFALHGREWTERTMPDQRKILSLRGVLKRFWIEAMRAEESGRARKRYSLDKGIRARLRKANDPTSASVSGPSHCVRTNLCPTLDEDRLRPLIGLDGRRSELWVSEVDATSRASAEALLRFVSSDMTREVLALVVGAT